MTNLVLKNSNTFIEVPLAASVEEIRASLPPATNTEINKSIAMLFTARKSGNRGDDDAQMTAEVYAIAIAGYPAYAIEAATMAIIKGEAPNIAPVFVPSTDEFCVEIKRQMWLRIRRESPPKEPLEIVLPTNHFSKKWEKIKREAMSGKVVTDAVE